MVRDLLPAVPTEHVGRLGRVHPVRPVRAAVFRVVLFVVVVLVYHHVAVTDAPAKSHTGAHGEKT